MKHCRPDGGDDMSEKEKQIEEMQKVIFKKKGRNHLFISEKDACEALYKAGYRRIPEGAIILTKEEIAALNKYNEKLKTGERK